MSPRRTSSNELTKEAILNEARLQFIKKGFQQVSMRSIAKQLGCSHGALYYHFHNKAELFYVIIDEYFNTLNDQIVKVFNTSFDNQTKLKKLFLSYIEFGLNHQSQYELMFMLRNSEVNVLFQDAANHSYKKFAQAVQSFADQDTLSISDIYSAFISLHGFVSHYRGYVGNFEEAKEAAYLHVDFIIKALTKI